MTKDRTRIILRSPDMIAPTFREVQAQAGSQREDLAGQRERLEARHRYPVLNGRGHLCTGNPGGSVLE